MMMMLHAEATIARVQGPAMPGWEFVTFVSLAAPRADHESTMDVFPGDRPGGARMDGSE
jgi:hypothetical protein